MLELLDSIGLDAIGFESADAFLRTYHSGMAGCLVLDIRMPGMNGLQLQKKLQEMKSELPIIFITGHGDVPMAVEAIKRGAIEFIQKPFRDQALLDCIQATMQGAKQSYERNAERKLIQQRLHSLTERERQALELISEGHPNKVIAAKMGISQRTVENHRAHLLEKLDARSTAALIRLLVLANTAN